jgi:ubiquinone/menaquinone biosynthesis C-methylase UbiE
MSDPFYDAGASNYDRAFGDVSRQIVTTVIRSAHLGPGLRVLDIAAGTGIAAEAAIQEVGASGHVVAADLSAPMLAKARERLGNLANVSFAIEDGQALTFPAESFDAVLCNMALMLFPDPARGLSEFRRVLRVGGRFSVSVNTTSERSFVTRILTAIGRHIPARAAVAAQYYSLGDGRHLRALCEAAGFQDVEVTTEARRFPFPSFDAYFDLVVQGGGSRVGTEYLSLAAEVRERVNKELRRELEGGGPTGGPIDVPVENLFASGRK